MSVMEQVRDKVLELGCATVDDLVPFFPWSRSQLSSALKRCAARKWLTPEGHRRVSGRGRSSALPPRYRPYGSASPLPTVLRPIPPASVWDLAQSRGMAHWPPRFDGGRAFQLLGDWNAEEAAGLRTTRKDGNMKRDDAIDYFLVPDRQLAVHGKLEEWARWVRVRPSGWQVAPMFRQYRSKSWQWHTPELRASVNIPEAVAMEKAVSLLPEKHREAIRWAYVWQSGPVATARRLAVTKEGLLELIQAGRLMLANRL